MNTGALDSLTRLGQRPQADISARDAARLDEQQFFANVLQRARQDSAGAKQANEDPRAAAENFISIALVEPILKKLRDSNEAAGPFAPGKVEKSFRGMLDRTLSQRIVQSGHWSLVQKVEESIQRRAGGGTSASAQPLQTELGASTDTHERVTSLGAGLRDRLVTNLASDPLQKPLVTTLNTPGDTPRVTNLVSLSTR